MTTRPVRVASVPSGHVYVHHLADPDAPAHVGAERLPDPHPDHPSRPATDRWWPPVMLDPGWAAEAADAGRFDVYHLHFGFDARPPADLARLAAALRDRGVPLVYTVHDLRNPHHLDRAAHDAQLDVLVPAADALLTLTPGAAAEVERRWGRRPLVVPHPHVVELPVAARRRAERAPRGDGRPYRVGVHLKSLRASTEPAVLPVLVDVVASLPDAVLQVNVHRDLLDPAGPRHDAGLAARLAGWEREGRVELVVHDRLDDDGLWRYLALLDLSVLPYRFGTHSGWLEACRDLGTAVLAPTCGYLQEQADVLTFPVTDERLDGEGLAEAVRRAHAERPDHAVDLGHRRHQRRSLAATHDALYRRLVEERAA